MKKKILIIGASGLIGNAIFHRLKKKQNFDTYGTIKRKKKKIFFRTYSNKIFANVQIENEKKIIEIIKKIKPSIIINCAAVVKKYINLYSAKQILNINSKFPKHLEHLSLKYKFKLIQISSDCVFDGKSGNYSETDAPNPNDLYGLSKYLGEVYSANCITLRTSVIGPELNKSQGLFEWFMKQKGKISGYKNFIFTGLTSNELAKIVVNNVLKLKRNGIIHISSRAIDKYTLLKKIQKVFKKDNVEIKLEKKIKINRSLVSKFQKKYNVKVSSWDKMILDMKKQINENI
jgi:dTDP-4-dehydrorhamnose reductase